MGLQGTQSLCALTLGCVFLCVLLTTTARTVPSLRTDTLLCYFCPLQDKSESCENFTTQCTPDQVCAISRGHTGSLHVMSAQGCVKRDLCGSHQSMSKLGVRYDVSHSCCCEDKCNYRPKSEGSLKLLLGMIQALDSEVHVRGAAHMSLLWLYLLLPSLMCENMLCYYSPYSTKETQGMFKLVVTECPPKHVCYKAQGYYGAHATLTQRGCMLVESCSQGKKISLRGAIFNTTYSCCEWNYCNSSPSTSDTMIRVFISTAALILLLMEN
uniref:UPAR/Ly6 domain-containing protein n=1 Tax=Knipowitschia caucasica TaxID=637954 RepID=A0AAV2KY76_KNICA